MTEGDEDLPAWRHHAMSPVSPLACLLLYLQGGRRSADPYTSSRALQACCHHVPLFLCPPFMLCLQIGSTALNHAPGPCYLDAIMQGQLMTLSLWHLQGGKSSAGIWTSVAEHPTSFAVTDLDGSEDGNEVAVSVAAELLPQAVSDSLSSEVDCTAWLDTDRWVQHDWRAGLWSASPGGSSSLQAAAGLGSTCISGVERLCSS